jgi:transcription elongation factor SPT5
MTPAYEGNRTPGHSSAWDPTIANTPARQSPMDHEVNYDEPAPSPYGNVLTPGSANPSTPGYAPDTPMGECCLE